jgi:tRNA modification GTPase
LLIINNLTKTFTYGNAIKRGIPVAIVGGANTGKSTLLNRILKEDKAIVSHIAGTTRDVIEDVAIIAGIQFRFIDTAGIRDTNDIIETKGIEKNFFED